jgi:hypothetical protein
VDDGEFLKFAISDIIGGVRRSRRRRKRFQLVDLP